MQPAVRDLELAVATTSEAPTWLAKRGVRPKVRSAFVDPNRQAEIMDDVPRAFDRVHEEMAEAQREKKGSTEGSNETSAFSPAPAGGSSADSDRELNSSLADGTTTGGGDGPMASNERVPEGMSGASARDESPATAANEAAVQALVDAEVKRRLGEEVAIRLEDLRAEAMAEGENQGRQAYDDVREKLEALLGDLDRGYQHLLFQLETQMIDLSMAVAGSVIGTELRIGREFVTSLVKEAVLMVATGTEVELSVSAVDLPAVEQIVEEMRSGSTKLQNLFVKTDPAIEAGCVVESKVARVDATIKTRLNNVAEALHVGAMA